MKVQHKLLGAFLAAAALVAVPCGLVLYADAAAARQAAISEAQQVADGIAREISYSTGGRAKPLVGDPAALAVYLGRLHSLQHRDIAVVGRDLRILGDVVPESVGEVWAEDQHGEVAATIADGGRRTFTETSDDYPDGIQQVVVPIMGASHAVEGAVVLEYTPLYRQMTDVTTNARRVVTMAGPICVLLVVLLGIVLARSMTRRINALTEAVRMVRAGNYAQRVALRGSDEISALGNAFDEMAERLESSGREILAKEYTDSILAGAGDGICGVDANGRITFANEAAGRISGLGVNGLLGYEASALLPETDRWSNDDTEREGTLYRPDGTSARVAFLISSIVKDGTRTGAVVVLRDVTLQRALEHDLRHQALHDALTGLPNRKLFLDRLAHATVGARSTEAGVAVLYLDLDGFKKINDDLGHSAGDHVLKAAGERLTAALRRHDTVARLGGDEFAVLLDGVDPLESEQLAQLCVDVLSEPFRIDGRDATVTVSVGLVPDTTRYGDADEVLRHADEAMYAAKSRGKACYQIFEDQAYRQLAGQRPQS